jgi:hypothetical protein
MFHTESSWFNNNHGNYIVDMTAAPANSNADPKIAHPICDASTAPEAEAATQAAPRDHPDQSEDVSCPSGDQRGPATNECDEVHACDGQNPPTTNKGQNEVDQTSQSESQIQQLNEADEVHDAEKQDPPIANQTLNQADQTSQSGLHNDAGDSGAHDTDSMPTPAPVAIATPDAEPEATAASASPMTSLSPNGVTALDAVAADPHEPADQIANKPDGLVALSANEEAVMPAKKPGELASLSANHRAAPASPALRKTPVFGPARQPTLPDPAVGFAFPRTCVCQPIATARASARTGMCPWIVAWQPCILDLIGCYLTVILFCFECLLDSNKFSKGGM